MSIAKNTQRRKKVTQQTASPASQTKASATRPRASQKAAHASGNDLDNEVYRLLRSLSVAQRLAYAALFHAAMLELQVAWRRPSAKRRQAVAAFLDELQQESRNRRYRRILRALAAAAIEGNDAMMRAYQTARLAVQTVLEWSADYRFIFGDYQSKRRPSRQGGAKAPAAK